MNDLLLELITTINGNVVNLNITERNTILSAYMSITQGGINNYEAIKSILYKFPGRDYVEIVISNVIDESLVINSKDIGIQESNYKNFIQYVDDSDELSVQIDIKKEVINGILSVYNIEAFNEYLLNLSLIDVIKFFEVDIQDNEKIILELFNSEMFLATNTIMFRPYSMSTTNTRIFKRNERIKECRKNSFVFWETSNFPIPDDFHFIIDTLENNPYKDIFNRIESFLSIVYISDSTHFEKDKIACQVMGQRMNVYEFFIKDINYNEVLFDIYSWIYTDGNIIDKVTLARNLLSLHCRYILLKDIDEKTFMSIKANFSLYQKENVDKYIDIKNKMTEFLNEILNQSKEIVLDIVAQIGNNIVAFFSFVLTVFISSIMSEKGLENIFSKDITYFSYVFILGSIIYIYITNYIVKYKVNKLRESYTMLKTNNDFFSNTREYEDIFRNEDVESTITEINIHKRKLFVCWGLLVLAIFFVVEYLSAYSISKTAWQFICDVVHYLKTLSCK